MNARLFIQATLLAMSTLLATTASAHDPKDFDRLMGMQTVPKSIPTSCASLADTVHFSNDETNPDIKALKKKCDAENAAAAKKAEQAAAKPPKKNN